MTQTHKKGISSATGIIVRMKCSISYCSCSRLQTSWTVTLPRSTRSQREKCSSWTHKALFSWCRSEPHTRLCPTTVHCPLYPPSLLYDYNAHVLFFFFFLIPRYRSGIRGHMKAVVMDLLRQYLKVEIQFQNGMADSALSYNCLHSSCTDPSSPLGGALPLKFSCIFKSGLLCSGLSTGHYDKCVFALREENKVDMANVLNYIFSHAQVTKKNLLVTMLIVSG